VLSFICNIITINISMVVIEALHLLVSKKVTLQ
jgi:hypothetical protein